MLPLWARILISLFTLLFIIWDTVLSFVQLNLIEKLRRRIDKLEHANIERSSTSESDH